MQLHAITAHLPMQMQFSLFRQLRADESFPLLDVAHAAHVVSSLRGLGLLASPLGPLLCPDVCEALCTPLAPDDWHHRLLVVWMEQALETGPDGCHICTGVVGDLCDINKLEGCAHRHAPARELCQRPKRPGQHICTRMCFTDLLPCADVRGHVTMAECDEGSETLVFDRYFTPAVQAEMRQRGPRVQSMCERRLSGDIAALPAVPCAVLLS